MLDNIIQWFNAYPSRKIVMLYVLAILYMFFVIKFKSDAQDNKELDKRHKKCKRFVYCEGKKSNISYVEFVTQFEYDNLLSRDENGTYHEISYAIIDRNTSSTYFKLP